MPEVLFDYSWDDEDDDALFRRLAASALERLSTYARSIGADNEYVYLNYADRTQNPLRGYGDENVEYMRRVARGYDPTGVFQHQVPGGFKVSAA
jgi:FAD/FMN-containing dehydrogenase